jgi:hypothetical protein
MSTQLKWLLLYLIVALTTCMLIGGAARDRRIEHWMTAQSSLNSARNGMLFSNNGSFIDYEERLFLDEIPSADFSQGGLYFFGTSNMKWAFTVWDLPERLRLRLHNYGTGAASHQTILRLVRYIGNKGMFAAAHKSTVIIGASYHLGTTETSRGYFPALVRRQGVYQIAPDDSLIEAPLHPADRWFRIEKARCGGFVRNTGRLIKNWALASLDLKQQPPHFPDFYRKEWAKFMGPDWQRNIDREVDNLEETLKILNARDVPVKLILLPQGSWMDGLPFPTYYNDRVRTLARRTATPVLDWSNLLPDSDFVDSNHLTVEGQTKFRAFLFSEKETWRGNLQNEVISR